MDLFFFLISYVTGIYQTINSQFCKPNIWLKARIAFIPIFFHVDKHTLGVIEYKLSVLFF